MSVPILSVYRSRMRGVVYVLNFVFSLAMASTSYFASNYFTHFGLGTEGLSYVFAGSAIAALITFYFTSYLFNTFGLYRVFVTASLILFCSNIVLGFSDSLTTAIAVYLLGSPSLSIIVASLDSIMEDSNADESKTGGQRGVFLTLASLAYVAGPVLGGQLVKGADYRAMWFGAATLIGVFTAIVILALRNISKKRYSKLRFSHLLHTLKQDKDTRNVFLAQFILFIFYAIMVFYLSVFLKDTLGYSFESISIILMFMLLPFVVLTMPVGLMADKWIGEREMMATGFIITGVATILFGMYAHVSWYAIITLLVLTRIGATLISTTTEIYFFKHVDGHDIEAISAFRALYPIANIVAPLLASVAFVFVDYAHLYILLGIFTLLGAFFAMKLRDTK